jgi:hypothetical protein
LKTTIACIAGWVVLAGCTRHVSAPDGTAAARRSLGGLDFDAYCVAQSATRSGLINGSWFCLRDGAAPVLIDINNACQRQYALPGALGVLVRPNDATSWTCFAPRPGELGGINLDNFCRSRGADRAERRGNDAACVGATGVTPIDFTAACRFQYPAATAAVARQGDPTLLTSWTCFEH